MRGRNVEGERKRKRKKEREKREQREREIDRHGGEKKKGREIERGIRMWQDQGRHKERKITQREKDYIKRES